ncbi:helix-turn-helix transcriptional regulator [Candidatus Aerophobetes bacterium]|nr:helix-turn-helix transcriptional regulator [Candidatus Aerophobetes bacterium]
MVLNEVKEMRLKRRLTQYALAKKLNKSPWWVSRVERGLTKVSESEKIKIAKVLGVEVREVFP